jgi:hypothetical protein
MPLSPDTPTSDRVGTIVTLPSFAAGLFGLPPRMRRPSALLLLPLAALTATLAFGAAPAAAKTPCWRALFVDWADGRIDKTYPVHCYREAIAHLQQDTLTYGDAADQINRALMAAMTKMRKDHDGPIGPNTSVPGGGPGSRDGPRSPGGNRHDESFLDRISHAIGPTNADAIPLPLLILAGLAMLLLAAAAASLIAKRLQARRTPPPAPSPAPPNRRP